MKQSELQLNTNRAAGQGEIGVASLQSHFIQSQADLSLGIELLDEILKANQAENILVLWRSRLTASELSAARVEWVINTLQADVETRNMANINPNIFLAAPIVAFDRGTWLQIKMRYVTKFPKAQMVGNPVLIRLDEQLYFEKGKSFKMKCSNCQCVVHICLREPINLNSTAEQLSIKSEKITSKLTEWGHIVEIGAVSLNNAYTLASRFLEIRRISHGGSIYQNIYFLNDKEQITPLSEARSMAENGSWKNGCHSELMVEKDFVKIRAMYAKATSGRIA